MALPWDQISIFKVLGQSTIRAIRITACTIRTIGSIRVLRTGALTIRVIRTGASMIQVLRIGALTTQAIRIGVGPTSMRAEKITARTTTHMTHGTISLELAGGSKSSTGAKRHPNHQIQLEKRLRGEMLFLVLTATMCCCSLLNKRGMIFAYFCFNAFSTNPICTYMVPHIIQEKERLNFFLAIACFNGMKFERNQ